jgi:hypothetical protein
VEDAFDIELPRKTLTDLSWSTAHCIWVLLDAYPALVPISIGLLCHHIYWPLRHFESWPLCRFESWPSAALSPPGSTCSSVSTVMSAKEDLVLQASVRHQCLPFQAVARGRCQQILRSSLISDRSHDPWQPQHTSTLRQRKRVIPTSCRGSPVLAAPSFVSQNLLCPSSLRVT